MKSTTTLMDIFQSELIKSGFNEFYQKNELTFFSKEHAFIQKVMSFDRDIETISNTMFFGNIKLDTPSNDKRFKRQFVTKFLNRQLAFQTIEGFSSQVVYTLLTYIDYINMLYDNLDDYINSKQVNTYDETGNSISDNRFLESDLPQNNINLNIDDTVLNYGNRNTISRNKETRTGNKKGENKTFNLDNLIKTRDLIDDIFKEFDRRCFMQIW